MEGEGGGAVRSPILLQSFKKTQRPLNAISWRPKDRHVYYRYSMFWYIKSRNRGFYKSPQNPEIMRVEVWRFFNDKVEKL